MPRVSTGKKRRYSTIDELAEMPRAMWSDEERLHLYVEAYEDMHRRAAKDGDWKGQMESLKAAFDIVAWRLSMKTKTAATQNLNDGEAEPDLSNKSIEELRKLTGDTPKENA